MRTTNRCISIRVLTSASEEWTRMRDERSQRRQHRGTKIGIAFEPCAGTKPTRRTRCAFPYLAEPRLWRAISLSSSSRRYSLFLPHLFPSTGRSILRRSGVLLCCCCRHWSPLTNYSGFSSSSRCVCKDSGERCGSVSCELQHIPQRVVEGPSNPRILLYYITQPHLTTHTRGPSAAEVLEES